MIMIENIWELDRFILTFSQNLLRHTWAATSNLISCRLWKIQKLTANILARI